MRQNTEIRRKDKLSGISIKPKVEKMNLEKIIIVKGNLDFCGREPPRAISLRDFSSKSTG